MSKRFRNIKDKTDKDEAVYMPYVMMGYPNFDASLEAAKALIDNGADALELGIPFRDPVADGPIIQEAANVALDNKFKTKDGIEFIKLLREHSKETPITVMAYYNLILAKRPEYFIRDLAAAGADAILIPDLPPEHASEIFPHTQKHDLELIFIVAPTTNTDRLNQIKPYASGFIYVVTKMGITGLNDSYDDKLGGLFQLVKSNIDLPAIAGFGISTPEHASAMIKNGADGVIIGSKIIDFLNSPSPIPDIKQHTKSICEILSVA